MVPKGVYSWDELEIKSRSFVFADGKPQRVAVWGEIDDL